MSLDISVFTNSDFDPKKWINQQLATPAVGTTLESSVSGLSLKLQLNAQDVNTMLEETLSQSIVRLPRIMLEVGRMAAEAQQLRETLTSLLQSDATTFSAHGTHDRDAMAKLYQIKTKLEICKLTLQQAAYLTQNVAHIDELFRSQGPDEITSEISKLQAALKAVEGFELHNKFKQEIATAEQRLQGMIETQCVEQMLSRNVSKANASFSMLCKIGRNGGVVTKYITHATANLKKQWETPPPTQKSTSAWIEANTTATVSLLKKEHIDIEQLFQEESHPVIKQLIHYVLGFVGSAVQPKVEPLSLPEIVECCLGYCPLLHALPHEYVETGLKPFRTLLLEYTQKEAALINANYKTISWVSKLNDETTPLQISPVLLTSVHDSAAQFFVWMESAIQRCLDFTDGTQWIPLCSVIKNAVDGLSGDLKKLGECLRQAAQASVSSGATDSTIIRVVFQLHSAVLGFQQQAASFESLFKKCILQNKERTMGSLHLQMVPPSKRDDVSLFVRNMEHGETSPLPFHSLRDMVSITNILVVSVLCMPISLKLSEMTTSAVWGTPGARGLSNFAPTEHVRAVGDILIELPMVLEAQGLVRTEESDEITKWIEIVLERTVEEYCRAVSALTTLTPAGAEQLGTDIEYVDNVLSAITDQKFDVLMDFYNVTTSPIESIETVEVSNPNSQRFGIQKLIEIRKNAATV